MKKLIHILWALSLISGSAAYANTQTPAANISYVVPSNPKCINSGSTNAQSAISNLDACAGSNSPSGPLTSFQYNNGGSFAGGNMYSGLNGNVGINNSSPSYQFDVSGASRFSNNVYVQGNLGVGSLAPGQALDVQGTMRASLGAYVGTQPLCQQNGTNCPGGETGFANPTGTIGLTAVNGVLTTAPRSDSAPALSQAIVPTWIGLHTFNASPTSLITSGNVGIGSPTPGTSLDVVGTIRGSALIEGPMQDKGGQVYNVQQYGWLPDDTDRSTQALALLTTIYNAGGGTLFFPAATGTYRADSQLLIPNNGGNPYPTQVALRFTAPGSAKGWGSPPGATSTLDLRYQGTGGKILTLGGSNLTIDHLSIEDKGSSNTTPFIYTTDTVLTIKDDYFTGTGNSGQDAVVLGGTNTTSNGTYLDPFGGYGTVIDNNTFNNIGRGVYGRNDANGIVITNNSWINPTGGPDAIEFACLSNATCSEEYIAGNTIEVNNYQYGIVFAYTYYSTLVGNGFYDMAGPFLYRYNFTHSVRLNIIDPTYTPLVVTGDASSLGGLNVMGSYTDYAEFFQGGQISLNTGAAPLNILDASGGVAIGSYAGIKTAPSNGLIVSNNVGIGSATPGQALDVQGTMRSSLGIYQGSQPVCLQNGTNCPGGETGFANPTAKVGLTVVNGSATTAMRSDAAPPIDQTISPTWTGTHTFSNGTYSALFTGGNVGIGTWNPTKNLQVNGAINAMGTNPIYFGNDTLAAIQGSSSTGSNILINNNTSASLATGGVITSSSGNEIHTFTTSGTFTPNFTGTVQVLIVAGGGSGGTSTSSRNGAGGGGGGGIYGGGVITYNVMFGTPITVTVGAGGLSQTSGSNLAGNSGSNTVFGTDTAIGGGAGSGGSNTSSGATSGGSGGGAAFNFTTGGLGTAGQGNNGGSASPTDPSGCGGGGANTVGANCGSSNTGSNGGTGYTSTISGSSVVYGDGGGGGSWNSTDSTGGSGNGGAGGGSGNSYTGQSGATNTGSGGGAAGVNNAVSSGASGAGGSGIVIVSFPKTSASLNTVFSSSGNVGIGSATPGQVLDVNGAIRTTGTNAHYFGSDNTASVSASAATSANLNFFTNSLQRLTITNGGNVGIGTAAPLNNLAVVGNVSIGAAASAGLAAPTNGLYVQGNVGIGSTNPGSTLDVQGTVTAFRVLGGGISSFVGNVGIGSINPGKILDVQGTTRIKGTIISDQASAPTCSSCGTCSVTGSDNGFRVTVGTTTSCTASFSQTYANNPACTCMQEGTSTFPVCAVSTSAVTCSTVVTGDALDCTCFFN